LLQRQRQELPIILLSRQMLGFQQFGPERRFR
jgi:hypothetical protein